MRGWNERLTNGHNGKGKESTTFAGSKGPDSDGIKGAGRRREK